MKILFIADIMGSPGRKAVKAMLPVLKDSHAPDVVIANSENSAGGNGITAKIAEELFAMGVNVLTGGNHSWDNKDGMAHLDKESRLLRPHNYPEENPGSGVARVDLAGDVKLTVLNLQGRIFMPPIHCPFRTADEVLENLDGPVFVDFHAEATSEKAAMAHYLDGRITALVGTHTHVQTADARVLSGGTALLTDGGMTGPHDSVIGMTSESTLPRFLRSIPSRFEVAKRDIRIQGALIEFDENSGQAKSIEAFNLPLKEDA
jgi:2',3'-cyclic-nucleotide 2'-phosphodiesterase